MSEAMEAELPVTVFQFLAASMAKAVVPKVESVLNVGAVVPALVWLFFIGAIRKLTWRPFSGFSGARLVRVQALSPTSAIVSMVIVLFILGPGGGITRPPGIQACDADLGEIIR